MNAIPEFSPWAKVRPLITYDYPDSSDPQFWAKLFAIVDAMTAAALAARKGTS